MNDLAKVQPSMEVSEINAFEIAIQGHEKELNFIPCMDTTDSVKLSSDALKSARKTWKLVDDIRLEKKKDAEKLANAIHKQGKDATNRLEAAYNPHKAALDAHKAELKAIEEAIKQQFFDACEWLHDVANLCQFAPVTEIEAFIAEVNAKDIDNTGLNLDKNQKLEYGKARMNIIPKLAQSLNQRIIADAEQARQQQAAFELAEQQEDMRKKQEAFEAQQQEQAKADAAREAKEQAERQAKINAEQAAKDAQLKIEAAEQAAKQAVIDKDNAEKQAVIDAENAKKQAVIDAENNRIAEEQRIEAAKKQAAEDEYQRLHAESEERKREEAERKKNRTHQGKILGEAKVALMAKGIDEEVAKAVLKLIAAGKVPHTTVKF